VQFETIAPVDGDADPGLTRIAQAGLAARPPHGVLVAGVTGGVAAGKSVFAQRLGAALAQAGLRVEQVATDGFLHPNARLTELGLLDQKGFPPSYDTESLRAALTAIRSGPVEVPGYSHALYDIDPALSRRIAPPDVLIVEGLNLRRPGAADAVDLLIYLDAEEADLEAWFTARFLDLWAAAEHDPTSFYARFRHLDRAGAAGVAKWVWDGVNLPNLRQHIAPGKAEADLVAIKGADHRLTALGKRSA
jgi:type I pantothenate kinase